MANIEGLKRPTEERSWENTIGLLSLSSQVPLEFAQFAHIDSGFRLPGKKYFQREDEWRQVFDIIGLSAGLGMDYEYIAELYNRTPYTINASFKNGIHMLRNSMPATELVFPDSALSFTNPDKGVRQPSVVLTEGLGRTNEHMRQFGYIGLPHKGKTLQIIGYRVYNIDFNLFLDSSGVPYIIGPGGRAFLKWRDFRGLKDHIYGRINARFRQVS